MPAREWDAKSYDRISGPMEAMGRKVLDRLELRGDETVLDAGCGSGRVTAALIERLPDGHVIAVDGSAGMIDSARERLGDSAELAVQDLLDLDLGGRTVDAVLSTATFHWIADHDTLFANLHAVLEPGGRLVAQCGGFGNVERIHAIAAEVGQRPEFSDLAGWVGPWNFQTAEATAERLHEAGFEDVRTWLAPEPVETHDGLEYLRTIILGSHLERLAPEVRDDFVAQVGAMLGTDPLHVDYVRLNIDATA